MRLFIIALVFIAMLSVTAFFSAPTIKEIRRSRAIESEIENLRKKANKISVDNSFLKEQIEYLKSDHYKERLAKDKLNLRNQGEQVVIVQPSVKNDIVDQNREKNIDEANDGVKKDISNFEKWWKYFFN